MKKNNIYDIIIIISIHVWARPDPTTVLISLISFDPQTCFNLSGWALLLSLDQTGMYSYILYLTWVYYSCLFFMEIASVFVQFRVTRRRKLKTEKNLDINQL